MTKTIQISFRIPTGHVERLDMLADALQTNRQGVLKRLLENSTVKTVRRSDIAAELTAPMDVPLVAVEDVGK